MISAVDWLISKFGTNIARNSKFHIRMTILCQLRDSVTPALMTSQIDVNDTLTLRHYAPNFEKVGDILVSACPYVCMYVRMYVFMF